MGQIGYLRRMSKVLQDLFANSEKRWLETVDEAAKGTLTLNTLVTRWAEMNDEVFATWAKALNLGGHPILPHIHITVAASDIVGHDHPEVGYLEEPVPLSDDVRVTSPLGFAGDVVVKSTVTAVVEFVPLGREEIRVTVTSAGPKDPDLGTYIGIVYRRDTLKAVATVSVLLT